MKRIILLTIILVFLTGCGIFDLSNWLVPDDLEFAKLINELNTPEKISNYMVENFTYKFNDIYNPDPYTLWKIKEGDCNDFATFGIFMAFHNDIEVFQIKIYYENTYYKHMLAIYVEDDGLSFTDNQYYYNNDGFYFDSIRKIVDCDNQWVYYLYGYIWTKYIVYDYWNNEVEVVYNE